MDNFKSKMMEKINLYSNEEYLDGYIKNEFITEDGDADIFLNIKDRDELFDSRTVGDQLDIVNDIYEFIEDKTSMLDSDVQINLHILGYEFESHEKEVIKHILKEHYAIELYKAQKEYQKIKKKIYKLIVIGLISLLGYLLLYLYTDFNFFMEVFGFLFSFALWEGFDSMIYNFSEAKKVREDVCQNLLMNVNFDNKKEL